jgi:hypothetical protein
LEEKITRLFEDSDVVASDTPDTPEVETPASDFPSNEGGSEEPSGDAGGDFGGDLGGDVGGSDSGSGDIDLASDDFDSTFGEPSEINTDAPEDFSGEEGGDVGGEEAPSMEAPAEESASIDAPAPSGDSAPAEENLGTDEPSAPDLKPDFDLDFTAEEPKEDAPKEDTPKDDEPKDEPKDDDKKKEESSTRKNFLRSLREAEEDSNENFQAELVSFGQAEIKENSTFYKFQSGKKGKLAIHEDSNAIKLTFKTEDKSVNLTFPKKSVAVFEKKGKTVVIQDKSGHLAKFRIIEE